MPSSKEKYFFINSLGKGMKVLEVLAHGQSQTVTGVAKQLGINRASSHRLLSTFREMGYVEKDTEARYHLTFKVYQLGMSVLERFEIRKVAAPFLQELASKHKETISIGYYNHKQVLTIEKIDSPEILRMDAGVGGLEHCYCTSLGKAILAHLSPEELSEYLEDTELKPLTPNTITDEAALRKELLKILEKGCATDEEEMVTGLRCVGAPVFNHTGRAYHAISISGPTTRMVPERVEEIKKDLKSVCHRLSAQLGYAL